MATIFNVKPGFAVAINDSDVSPMTLAFTGWASGNDPGFSARRAIVTGVTVAEHGNYQFLHTLRNFIYVYVFGDRMGDMVISGITFAGKCPGDNSTGMDHAMDYYRKYRIAKTGMPVNVQISKAGFRAFLINGQFNLSNPEWRIGQFALTLKSVPPDNGQ